MILPIICILLIVVVEAIANYAFIAQIHEAASTKCNCKSRKEFQERLSRIWHSSFFVMWCLVGMLLLINDLNLWWQIVLMGAFRITVFPTLINYFTNKWMFPRELHYLSSKGMDGIIKKYIGQTPFYYIKWIFLLALTTYIIVK